jgi:hypothetical protein
MDNDTKPNRNEVVMVGASSNRNYSSRSSQLVLLSLGLSTGAGDLLDFGTVP